MQHRSSPFVVRRGAALGLLLWLVPFTAVGAAQQAPQAVLATAVTDYAPERGIVALSAGSASGVRLGDQFWIFREGIYAAGEIQTVTDTGSTGAVEGGLDIPAGRAAAILRSAAVSSSREALPPEVTIRGEIERVAPGRRTAWLDIGSQSGLRIADTLLIRRPARMNMPLARGRVEVIHDRTALVVLQPIVQNTRPEPHDIAELWPSPSDRHLGRVESTVLAVAGPDNEQRLTLSLVGTSEDGLEPGRLVDLFRGREYVGHAIIERVGTAGGSPISIAKTVMAGQKALPREGDRAWVRAAPGDSPQPLSAAVFGIKQSPEGDVVLMAAGETDGVREEERFIVRHQDPADATVERDVAELTILKVNEDFSTASVRLLTPDRERVRQWDFADRLHPRAAHWRGIGIVQGAVIESRSALVVLEARPTAGAGRVVRWIPEPAPAGQPPRYPGAAIVIHRAADEAIVYVPPGWGRVDDLPHARVEAAGPTPAASISAPTRPSP